MAEHSQQEDAFTRLRKAAEAKMNDSLKEQTKWKSADGVGVSAMGIVLSTSEETKNNSVFTNHTVMLLAPSDAAYPTHFDPNADAAALAASKAYLDIPCIPKLPHDKSSTDPRKCWADVLADEARNVLSDPEPDRAAVQLAIETAATMRAKLDDPTTGTADREAAQRAIDLAASLRKKLAEREAAQLNLEEASMMRRSYRAWWNTSISIRDAQPAIIEAGKQPPRPLFRFGVGDVVGITGIRLQLYSYNALDKQKRDPTKIHYSFHATGMKHLQHMSTRAALAMQPFAYRQLHFAPKHPTHDEDVAALIGNRPHDVQTFTMSVHQLVDVCARPTPKMREEMGAPPTVCAMMGSSVVDPAAFVRKTVEGELSRCIRGGGGTKEGLQFLVMEGDQIAVLVGMVFDGPQLAQFGMYDCAFANENGDLIPGMWAKFGPTICRYMFATAKMVPDAVVEVEEGGPVEGFTPRVYMTGKVMLLEDHNRVAEFVRAAGIRLPPSKEVAATFLSLSDEENNDNVLEMTFDSKTIEFDNKKELGPYVNGVPARGHRVWNAHMIKGNMRNYLGAIDVGRVEMWIVANHRGMPDDTLAAIQAMEDWDEKYAAYVDKSDNEWYAHVDDEMPAIVVYLVAADGHKDLTASYLPRVQPKPGAPKKAARVAVAAE